MQKRDWLAEAAFREFWDQHRNSYHQGEMRQLESSLRELQGTIIKTTGEVFFQVFVNKLDGYNDWLRAKEAIAARKVRLGV